MDIQDENFKADLSAWIARELSPRVANCLQGEPLPCRQLIHNLASAGLMHQGWEAPFGGDDIRKQLYLHFQIAQQPAGGFGLCLASHVDIAARFLNKQASAALAASWLPAALKGERILALAMTEPDAGSDLQGISFSGEKTADGWLLNGTKRGVTNLPFADAAIVLVRTRAGRTPFSYSLFLLPLDAPGVTREAALPSLGYEACLGGLVARNVVLPDAHLIGPPGTGLINLMQHLELERLFVSARMLGMAHYMAGQISRDAVNAPDPWGQARLRAAEHVLQLSAFEAYFDLCVQNHCSGHLSTRDTACLKYLGSQLLKAMSSTYALQSVRQGYQAGHPAERCYRETVGLSLAGGSEEIMLSLIGREL